MNAQPGDLVAGGGCICEAVQFGGGKVGIALFTDQPGQRRRIAFVPSDEVQVLKLRQDWNGGAGPTSAQRQEIAEAFAKLATPHEQAPKWTR